MSVHSGSADPEDAWFARWHAPLVVGLLVALACMAGILSRPLGQLAAVWPANAVLLGLMVRWPALNRRACWAAAAAAYLAADLLTGSSLLRAGLLNAANIVGVAAGCWLFGRLGAAHRQLREPQSVPYMALAVVAASAAAGLVGALISPILFHGPILRGWTFWTITEFVNYVAVLPALLTVGLAGPASQAERRRLPPRERLLRALPALALALSMLMAVLVGGPGAVAFAVPALLWCALTYSLATTAVLTLVFTWWTLMAISLGYFHLVGGEVNRGPMLISIRIGVALLALAPITVASVMAARNALLRELRHLATHDPLSGLLNRRAFYERSGLLLRQLAAERRPVAVLMLDIDRFKGINDTHGHAAGDRVLAACARTAAGCLREQDVFGRTGGEEFAVLLPDSGEPVAGVVAERIRTAVAALAVEGAGGAPLAVSLSIGLTWAAPADPDLEALLAQADRALYRAKHGGRNRVEAAAFVAEAERPSSAQPA